MWESVSTSQLRRVCHSVYPREGTTKLQRATSVKTRVMFSPAASFEIFLAKLM